LKFFFHAKGDGGHVLMPVSLRGGPPEIGGARVRSLFGKIRGLSTPRKRPVLLKENHGIIGARRSEPAMTTYPVYPFIRLREFVLVGGFIVVLSMVAALLTGWAQEWMAISRAQRDIARTIPTLTAAERSTLANERWAQVVDGCWPPRAELLWATQGATFADSISQAQLACARRALDPLWDADAVDRTQRAVLVARAAERAGYRVEVAWAHPELFSAETSSGP